MEILAGDDAILTQNGLNCFACQFRMVVLLAEMTEPHVLQPFAHVLGYGLGAVGVAEVAVLTQDAAFEIGGVRSVLQHLDVVVGLDDQVVGLRDEGLHLVGNGSSIGDDAEVHAVGLNHIANVLAGIVRHGERCDVEASQREGFAGHNLLLHRRVELALHAIVTVYALVDKFGGVYGKMIFVADAAHRLDVVGVVVSDQDIANLTKAETIVGKLFLQCSEAYSNVYYQSIRFGEQVVAISAATAPKGYKSKHFVVNFLQK